MDRIKAALARLKQLFANHDSTGAIHGPIEQLHEALDALAAHVETLGKAATTGVSAEFEAFVKGIQTKVEKLTAKLEADNKHVADYLAECFATIEERFKALEDHAARVAPPPAPAASPAEQPAPASAETVADQDKAAAGGEQAATASAHKDD